MKRTHIFQLALIFCFIPAMSFAQSEILLDKALKQAVKTTSKSGVTIPGLDGAGESSDELSSAVESAISGSLKEGKKAGLFSAKGLGSAAIGQIASSGKPFTSLLELKEGSRKQYEGILGKQLEKTGALGLLEKAGGIPGLNLPVGGMAKDGLSKLVADASIDELDKAGTKMIDKFVK